MSPSFFRRIADRFNVAERASDDPPPMIDIHCHLLPGVDDGPRDWETALEMCRLAQQDGTQLIVATPHANARYEYNREQHESAISELRERFPDMEFVLGCDFHCSYENIQDAIANPTRYTIGNTHYLLLEFNDYATTRQMVDTMAVISGAGFRGIVTHPERMALATQEPQFARILAETGNLIQITANSLTGFWGSRVQKTAERMLKDGFVSIIASDGHEPARRVPSLLQAWRIAVRMVGADRAAQLVSNIPQAVLHDQDLYFRL